MWALDEGEADGGEMIRTFVVAEVRLYRDGLAAILDVEDDIDVIGTAADWAEALPLVRRLQPDIALLDLSISDGRIAVPALRSAAPDVRVIALSIANPDSDVISWAEAGVAGYVTRDDSIVHVLDVLRSVARDEMPCSPRVAATLLRRVGVLAAGVAPPRRDADLTSRELEVVELIERGLSNKEIASELHIEVTTVKNHVHNILEKLHVRRRNDAVATVRGRAPANRRQEVHG